VKEYLKLTSRTYSLVFSVGVGPDNTPWETFGTFYYIVLFILLLLSRRMESSRDRIWELTILTHLEISISASTLPPRY
jgi:hypothetical protein